MTRICSRPSTSVCPDLSMIVDSAMSDPMKAATSNWPDQPVGFAAARLRDDAGLVVEGVDTGADQHDRRGHRQADRPIGEDRAEGVALRELPGR